ncbi:MAG: phosphoglycerate mutase, partial [Candidatus Micrarchaeota archaeon]|nr:phosphoglycerate mutase [Candidatus Micrarchaeota archaeon]
GDVAFRCNFGTVDRRMVLTDRRAGRSETGIAQMTRELDGMEIDGAKLAFRHSVQHRAALVLSGKGLSNMVGNTDPHVKGNPVLECRPLDGSAEATRTAKIVNEFVRRSHKILNEHESNRERAAKGELPANIVVTRGAGIFERIPSLEEKHGFRSACVAGAALYKGVAAYVGMEVLDVPGATGTFDTDLGSKARVAKKALEKHDFVFLHVKATDNAGHDGKYDEKVRMIEKIDGMMKELLDTDAYIILTGDHSTPAIIGGHTADPVPIVVYAKEKGIRVDAVNWFDELVCARGGLGQIKGLDVMPIIAEMMGYARIYGS